MVTKLTVVFFIFSGDFMQIYVDFDDVVSETALHFSGLVKEMFGIYVPYGEIRFFNLQKAFALNDRQYTELMEKAHTPEILLSYEETPGASETIRKWMAAGHDVEIVTGRPFFSAPSTKRWLREHGLEDIKVIHVDKYGRQGMDTESKERALTVEEFSRMHFDFAVEDSPSALVHLEKMEGCRTAVFSRPWNVEGVPESNKFFRCSSWKEVDRLLEDYCREMKK